MSLIKGMLIKLVVLLVVFPLQVWGLNGARLISMSETGQTALFNLGIHDGVKEGDYAVIVKEIRSFQNRDLRLVPVAKARNVKITTANSVWILFKFYDPELLVKGQRYLILTESQLLSGRRDPRFGRMVVVAEKDKLPYQVKKVLTDDNDRIAKLKDQYPEVAPLHERESRYDNDGKLVDVEIWKKFKDDKYRAAFYKSPHALDFQRELRISTFEKLVTAYLKKVNDPLFSYDRFYDEQMKEQFADNFRVRSNFSTEYESFLSSQANRTIEDAKLFRSILEKGESWSEDYSDEELRRTLKDVSILQEKDRRLFVLSDPNQFAVFLSYGMTVNDTQTEKDPGFRRDSLYSIEGEFEWIPIMKHEVLERFTLTAGVRSNHTALETSANANAEVNELSASAGINWYPLYAPYVIESPAIYLGTYLRSGTANLRAPSVDEKSNYTILGFPAFRAGMKYNFRNNIGLRIGLSMETLRLDRYQQSKFGGILPDQTNLTEGKMNFAMAYSF